MPEDPEDEYHASVLIDAGPFEVDVTAKTVLPVATLLAEDQ